MRPRRFQDLKAANQNDIEKATHLDPKKKFQIDFRKRLRIMFDEILCGPDVMQSTALLCIAEEELERAYQIWKIRHDFDDGGPDAA